MTTVQAGALGSALTIYIVGVAIYLIGAAGVCILAGVGSCGPYLIVRAMIWPALLLLWLV